jgi:hypothetical protein
MKKDKLNEDEKFKIHVDKKTLENPSETKKLAMLKRKNPNIEFDLEPSTSQSSTSMTQMEENEVLEPEAIITPQDQSTIKYLSNVKDSNTGETSKPFTIVDKNYQMIRGLGSNNEIVMAVFCHDDMDDEGNNIIHSIDEFESKIALPMKERLEMESLDLQGADIQSTPDVQETTGDTYEGYKHYLVNKQTNEVRKFKTIEEMLSGNKLDEEEYMGVSKFKKHTNERLFGSGKKKHGTINEISPTGEESDEEMNIKAKKLMDMIKTKLPNVIATIKTPVAQREVIAAFAELIGVPRNGLSNLVSGLKDLAKQPEQPVTESKVITKNQLMESLKLNKVIKTIKVKDIK